VKNAFVLKQAQISGMKNVLTEHNNQCTKLAVETY
jgi:hypothetical protein